jgi:hypothetical protein
LGSVFFGLGTVWFFRFQAYKTETEPVGKILIGFFFTVRFFSDFLGLIGFRFFYSPLPRISITAFIRTEMKFSSICIFKNKTIHKKKKKKKKKKNTATKKKVFLKKEK